MVLYEYMYSLGNDVCNLFVNTHEQIKIYREFYHCIIYIANEECHVRISENTEIILLGISGLVTVSITLSVLFCS